MKSLKTFRTGYSDAYFPQRKTSTKWCGFILFFLLNTYFPAKPHYDTSGSKACIYISEGAKIYHLEQITHSKNIFLPQSQTIDVKKAVLAKLPKIHSKKDSPKNTVQQVKVKTDLVFYNPPRSEDNLAIGFWENKALMIPVTYSNSLKDIFLTDTYVFTLLYTVLLRSYYLIGCSFFDNDIYTSKSVRPPPFLT